MDGLETWMLGVVAAALLGLAATLGYFLYWQPRRKRRLLDEALALLDTDRDRAAELLADALTAGLRSADVDRARFALAYVRARQERYAEAAAILGEIPRERRDAADAYLRLWLAARQNEWDEATRLFAAHAGELEGMLQAAEMAGTAFLHQGRSHLARREIDEALACFRRLRELEVLAEHLPRDLDDHQLLLGVQALVDRNPEEAEKRFRGALEVAEAEDEPTLRARLGLLLCRWRAEDVPDVDDELGEIVRELAGAPDGGAPADEEAADPPSRELTVAEKLRRDAALWHALSRLFTWLRLPERKGLPDAERQEVERRLAAVREVDPAMGDPLLVAGLIDYYFAADDGGRARAVERLEEALATDVNLPEVRYLVEREHELAEAAAHSLESYLRLVRDYLADDGVPLELRRELKERLERFQRFADLGEVDPRKGEAELSLRDFQSRTELLQRRIGQMLKGPSPPAAEEIGAGLEELGRETRTLAETALRIEKSEQRLMVVTGELLFHEEEA